MSGTKHRVLRTVETHTAFTSQVFAPQNTTLLAMLTRQESAARRRVLVVLDEGLVDARHQLHAEANAWLEHNAKRLAPAAAPFVVEGGNAARKESRILESIQARLTSLRMGPQDRIVVVGGGGLLDAVRFAGATTGGGIPVVLVPSTVTAQAALCTAHSAWLDRNGVRRALGVHAPAVGIIIDSSLLSSLSWRDRIAGYGAAVDAAVHGDDRFFRWLRSETAALQGTSVDKVASLVRQAFQLNIHHAFCEPENERMPTLASLMCEALLASSQDRLREGEAMGLAVVWSVVTGWMMGLCEESVVDDVVHAVEETGLRVWDPLLVEDACAQAVFSTIAGPVLGVRKVGSTTEMRGVHAGMLIEAGRWLRCFESPPSLEQPAPSKRAA